MNRVHRIESRDVSRVNYGVFFFGTKLALNCSESKRKGKFVTEFTTRVMLRKNLPGNSPETDLSVSNRDYHINE